ncbi:MAG: PAS domain S-box protein, partial [Deltaproteobacteria bacterium]|nr:PAS domain S-box protein [Deltaproteobacteria bacterium]
ISLCLLGMAGVVMFLLVHRLLRPLEQMAAAVRGYRPDAPPPVIPVDSHDEIGELGRQFQQLIQEISTREQALMASERRYRDLIEGSLQGIIIIQGEDVVFANRAFLMGLNVPSLRSIRTLARLKTFLLPSYRNFVEIAIMDAMEGEEVPRRFRLRAQRRDGYNMVMDVLARVVSWNDRSAFQATLMDITRQVQAVEELNRSEAQMRLLLEKIHGLPWQMDGATLRFGYVGPQAEELLGFPRREWLKQNFRQNHIHPEDLPWVSDKIHRGAARGGNFELEYRMIRRDGQVVWLRDVIHVVPAIRGRKTLVGVSINITQARLTEDQLRHSLKMEAIGQLTGGVAHDFNNLLTVIIGNLGLLKSRVDPQTLAYALVEDAADAALRGANLTRQLLAFAHKHPQKKELMDLATLVEGMTGLLERSLGETIRLEIRPPENLWPVVLDKTQLGNALINLAVNSRDAMEEGGNLEIEMENTHLTPEQAQDLGADPGPYVVLKVRDTGQGMTREVLARAYDPFFTTKGVGRGSGLGLSMVHGFVTQSGGVVHLDSQVGKGTRASLYFPALENQSVPAVPQEDLKREKMEAKNGDRPLDGRVILVVEDDTALRHMLEKLMDKMGCRVLAAADGPEGLALLESHPEIDLLFSDVVMPEGMDGVALATQALLLRPRLKVLLTSGYSPRHSNDQDFPFELLPKPYNLNDLRDKILELLAQPPSSADLADPLLPLA